MLKMTDKTVLFEFRRLILFLCFLIFLGISACRSVSPKPEKIARLSALADKTEGSRVEFVAWIRDVQGDKELGFELNVSESASSYPYGLAALKDGQADPGKDKEICISGELFRREGKGAEAVYFVKEAEIVDCY